MIPSFLITGKPYEVVRWLVLIVLPAFSALYVGLGEINDWSNTATVAGTLALLTAFLGTILGISSHNFKTADERFDGAVNMQQDPSSGVWLYSLDLNDEVESIADKDAITFKVNTPELPH